MGPSSAMLSATSYRSLVSGTNGHAAPFTAAILDDEPTVEIPASWLQQLRARELDAKESEPQALLNLAPLDRLPVQPYQAPIPGVAKVELSPATGRSVAPALLNTKVSPTPVTLQPADLAGGEVSLQPSPGWLPKAKERDLEPVPSRRRSVVFLRAALHSDETTNLAVAGLARWDTLRFTPAAASRHVIVEPGTAAPLPPAPGSVALAKSNIQPESESLSEVLRALEKSAEELEQSEIHAIQASFEKRPGALLLSEPGEIIIAPAPPLERWLRTPKLVFTPQLPDVNGIHALSVGPQSPTLAGPCLPPQLRNLGGNKFSAPLARKRASAPMWMVSVLVATGLFLGGGTLLQYLSANREAKAASVPAASAETTETALPAPPVHVAQEHPGSRFVEVAGLRVVTAANKRQQVQYIVINHSTGQLTGLKIRITVYSQDSASSSPLFTVATIIPSLAPDQSKEIHTDLDASLTAASIPDWRSLKPEVLITRQ